MPETDVDDFAANVLDKALYGGPKPRRCLSDSNSPGQKKRVRDHTKRVRGQGSRKASATKFNKLSLAEKLDMPLAESGLPLWLIDFLDDEFDCIYVRDLLQVNRSELESTYGIADTSVRKIMSFVHSLKLKEGS